MGRVRGGDLKYRKGDGWERIGKKEEERKKEKEKIEKEKGIGRGKWEERIRGRQLKFRSEDG